MTSLASSVESVQMISTPRTSHQQRKAGSLPPDSLVVPVTLSTNLEFELNKALENLKSIADRVGAKTSWVVDILDAIDRHGVPAVKSKNHVTHTHALSWTDSEGCILWKHYQCKSGAHTERRKLIARGFKDAKVTEIK